MIDSHCHLDHEPLFENLNDVILNCKREGVEKVLTICTTVESFKNIINIVKKDKIIYGDFSFSASMGEVGLMKIFCADQNRNSMVEKHIFFNMCQPHIIDSLLANKTFLLILENLIVGSKPTIPTIAHIEISNLNLFILRFSNL